MDGENTEGAAEADYHEAVGRAIKVIRTEQGLERRDLAEASGVSYPYLSEIENGRKRASSRSLLAIANALRRRPHEVLARAESLGAAGAAGPAPAPAAAAAVPQAPPPPPAPAAAKAATAREPATEELEALMARLSPGDQGLLLEMARRLAAKGNA
jgi:transcriptional regulator with XRE-family HTH domain